MIFGTTWFRSKNAFVDKRRKIQKLRHDARKTRRPPGIRQRALSSKSRNDCLEVTTSESSVTLKRPTLKPIKPRDSKQRLKHTELKNLMNLHHENGMGRKEKSTITTDDDTPVCSETPVCSAEQPPRKASKLDRSGRTSPFKRIPLFPVLPSHVCFDWIHHRGTIKWLEIVKQFSDDLIQYPEWNVSVADLVKEKSSNEDCSVFLVFLDSQGEPSNSIHEGLWYPATEEEITERTRQQFQRNRCE